MGNNGKIVVLLIFLLILLIPNSLAIGTCSLVKNNFIKSETANFRCYCTEAEEKNINGYIVYIHNNGSILKSTAVNSGDCINSLFSNGYTFSDTIYNYNGSVIFSLNADGTGTPPKWGDIGDVRVDYWVVNQSTASNCLINFEIQNNNIPIFDLGHHASLSIELEDGNSQERIVGGRCNLHIENVNDVHIFSVPYNPPYNYITTTTNGEAAFEVMLDYDTLQPNTNYIVRSYCYCPTNSTEPCYLQGDGLAGTETGFKACSASIIAASGVDHRITNRIKDNFLGFIITFIFFSIYFFMIGLVNSGDKNKRVVRNKDGQDITYDTGKWNYWAMYTAFAFSGIELILLAAFVYAIMNDMIIDLFLSMHFWFMLIIGIFLFMLTMALSIVNIFLFNENRDRWKGKW